MRTINRAAARLVVIACGMMAMLALAACGGGGGNSGPSLTISLSPSSVKASFYQGGAYTVSEIATVKGTVSGSVYVEVVDSTGTFQNTLSLQQQTDDTYLATLYTVPNLTVGEHKGSLQIYLCPDQACSQHYGHTSLSFDFTVLPGPSVSSISPSSAIAGGSGFTLTVIGANFAESSTVEWNGGQLTTTFVSSTQLTAQVQAANIAGAGTYSVDVSDGTGSVSNAVAFTVEPPTLNSLTPNSASAGDSGFTLTVNGTNFLPSSTLQWDGSARPTTYISATQLTAQISATDISIPGVNSVDVANGGENTASNSVDFTVQSPALTTTVPASATAGGPAFTITVAGSNFVASTTLQWNGSARPTTLVSPTQVTAQLQKADIANAGSDLITVANGSADAVSNALTFTVNNPLPTLGSVTPDTITTGGPGFTITANGGNFVSTSTLEWNGAAHPTTFVSPTTLTAQISAADIRNGGSVAITVNSPAPGGGTSAAVTFTVSNPVPSLSAINANSAAAGCAAFTIYVEGSSFVPNSVVHWNGNSRSTTFKSASLLTAQITAADVAAAGSASVTVFNPSPGGGTSHTSTFTIASSGTTTDAVAYQINPAHSGSATTACPVSFPSSSLWTVDLGAAQSYPLIADGLVFATIGFTQMYALDQATGNKVWGPVNADSLGTAYGNKALFVVGEGNGSSESGLMTAFNAESGVMQWSTQLPGQYSFSSGATAADGLVFTGGAGSGGTIYAVNQTSGQLVWTAGVANGDASDPAITADGVYVTYPCQAYDFTPSTGALVWHYSDSCDGGGGSTMAVADGIALAPAFTSGAGKNFNAESGAVLGNYVGDNLAAIGSHFGYFVQSGILNAIDVNANHTAWSFAGTSYLVTSPILVNQILFVGTESGALYALDANNGALLWQTSIPGRLAPGYRYPYGVSPALAAGDGLLVVPSGNTLIAFRISSSQ